MMAVVTSLVPTYPVGKCVDWHALEHCVELLMTLDRPLSHSRCSCIRRLGLDNNK